MESIKDNKLKLIIRKNGLNESKFDKLSEVLMSFHLMTFFNEKELKEVGKVNVRFYNSFVRFFDRTINNLIEKYNLKVDKEYDKENYYEQQNDKGHLIKFSLNNIEHLILFSDFEWTWSKDLNYWEKIPIKNSLFSKNIYHLIKVCYIDINLKMTYLFKGQYKLYIRHCVCLLSENSIKISVFLDNNLINELTYPSINQINKCNKTHCGQNQENFKEKRHNFGIMRPFNRRLKVKRLNRKKCGETEVLEEYIMDLDINNDDGIDGNIGHVLKICFDHNNGDWKRDWFIDAIIIRKIL